MRHPGLQARNRLNELSPKFLYAIGDLRDKRYEAFRARKALEVALAEVSSAESELQKINSIWMRMADGADGIFPWGLPRTIKIAEFKAICPNADIPDKDKEVPAELGADITKGDCE